MPVPWTTTVMNTAYRSLLDSFNVAISVSGQRVIQGTVTGGGAGLPANGKGSVPVTLVVEATAGQSICGFGHAEMAAPQYLCVVLSELAFPCLPH